MWMCRQVAKALAESRYYELPLHRRIGLKIHIALCAVCGKYHRQVVVMQDGVKSYLEHEEADDVPSDVHIPEDVRDRLRANFPAD